MLIPADTPHLLTAVLGFVLGASAFAAVGNRAFPRSEILYFAVVVPVGFLAIYWIPKAPYQIHMLAVGILMGLAGSLIHEVRQIPKR